MTDNQINVTLRGPADLAEAIPYHLGFHPHNSLVLVGTKPPAHQVGGVLRIDLPQHGDTQQLAAEALCLLLEMYGRRNVDLGQIMICLYRDPEPGSDRTHVAAELAPLANHLIQGAKQAEIFCKEVLLISDGHWSSYLCTKPGCCPPTGTPLRSTKNPGPVGAAYVFAGLTAAPSRTAIEQRLRPNDDTHSKQMADTLAKATPVPRDGCHDLLIACLDAAAAGSEPTDEQTAQLLLALRDRNFRDLAAAYSEEPERAHAARLWQHLAISCAAPHRRLAAAPLTLLAWNSWLLDDRTLALVALTEALSADPDYQLAQLLHALFQMGGMEQDLQKTLREFRAEYLEGAS